MTTQYVNKATLNGTTTVYWTTTGAADGTGAQSGYNPANLTNIGVDYTTTVSSTSTGGNTLNNGGWTTALDLDFRDQPSQTLSADTNYTIAGKTWTKQNSSHDATAMALTNGTGLVVTPNNSSSDYNMIGGGGRSAPLLELTLSQIIPNFNTRMRIRLWVYITSENNAALYDNALFGFDVGAGSVSYVGLRGNHSASNPGFGGQMYFNANGGGFFGRGQTLSSANSVVMMEIPVLGDPIVQISAGSFGTDWPDVSEMVDMTAYQFSGSVNASTLTAANAALFLGAMRYQSATSFAVTFAKVKVEYISTEPLTLGTICTSDGYANLPTAGIAGRIFLPTDKNIMYRDNGTTWVAFGDRYTPTDSNTIINWKFNETGSPYANSGTGAALSLTTFSGTPAKVTGLFNNALGCSSMILSTGNSSVNESFTNALTVSAWIKPRTYSTYGTILNKSYRNDNSWSSPFVAFYLSLTNAGDGSWAPAITINSTLYQPTQTGAFRVPLYQWSLIAFTFDGSNIRCYINGALSGTTAASGTISYGTHGPWDVGGVSNAGTGQQFDGHIDDIRVENVVRSQTYLEIMYKNGVGLFE